MHKPFICLHSITFYKGHILLFFEMKSRQKNLTQIHCKLIKKKREKTQINRTRSEKGEVTTDTAELQRIMRDYYKQLYENKMENLEEMDKFLEK